MEALTQKEISLLNDAKSKEEICVEKYNKYSSQATEAQLQNLFQNIAQKEQQHLDSINQILSGTVPNMNAGQQQQQMQAAPSNSANANNPNDKFLCSDALSTEKHVSSVYNTAIFEFKDTCVRDFLNHIQKEEQQHGEQIYNYMSQNGMYN